MLIVAFLISGCLPYYFGSDNNSLQTSQSGTSTSFYLGRLGEGSSPSTFFTNPNPCPANNFVENVYPGSDPSNVNPQLQFGWWWITGPDQPATAITSLTQAYNLGWNEGVQSFECWNGLLWHRYPAGIQDSGYGGLNIFADVEINISTIDPTDWYVPNSNPVYVDGIIYSNTSMPTLTAYNLNIQTLIGFLDAVSTYTNVSPGVYISTSTMNAIMPGLNLDTGCSINQCPDPHLPGVLWQASGCSYADIITTVSPPDPSTVENNLDTIESYTSTVTQDPSDPSVYEYSAGPCSIADLSAAIWQYTVSYGSYPNDFNIVDPNQVLEPQASVPSQNECINEQLFFATITSCGDYFNSTGVPIGTS